MAAKTELDPKVIEAAKTLQHTPWCDEYEKMISGMLYVHQCIAVSGPRARGHELTRRIPGTTRWSPS